MFAFTGALLFLIEYFAYSTALDLNFHDTYFVVARLHVGLLLLVQFSFLGLCYFVFKRINRPLNRSLGLIHYFVTAFTVLFFALGPLFLVNVPRRAYEPSDAYLQFINIAVTIIAILFLVAQALFVLNIALSIFRKNSKP